MKQLEVRGRNILNGTVDIPKAKNSIMPILAATLLCEGESRIEAVPALLDVDTSIAILRSVGAETTREGTAIRVDASGKIVDDIPKILSAAMRSSVYYLAPLLKRCGSAFLPSPGGCRLGDRPINLHLDGLEAMGVTIKPSEDGFYCTAPNGLHGAEFHLSFPSVGATETLMMAASVATGKSVINNAAKEPEIDDLAQFLNSCGATIRGAGTSCITIYGKEKLLGAVHTPIADRISAATVLIAAAAAGGEVTVTNVSYLHISPVIRALCEAGCTVTRPAENSIMLKAPQRLTGCDIITGVHPSFPTDAGPLFAAAMLTAKGDSHIVETIFDDRFACADEFLKMGAELKRDGKYLTIHGVDKINGAAMEAKDLRGGAAIVVAALTAEDSSVIIGTEYISRGYADIAELFTPLGGEISFKDV